MVSKKRPTVEEISLDRAMELLSFHKDGKISGKAVVNVVRDPENWDNILSISLAEKDVLMRPSPR